MLLASIAIGVVIVALLWDLLLPPRARPSSATARGGRSCRTRVRPGARAPRRAAGARAAALVRERRGVVDVPRPRLHPRVGRDGAGAEAARAPSYDPRTGAPYAYLVYPHKPIVAYLPQTRELLNEYCVAFPDETRPYGSARLPDSDDVLAKWMALTGDERRLIATANMHLPGRQVDPKQVRRDLWRLSQWERERLRRSQRPEGSVPAP
jgi:hypothetical protein